MKIFFACGGSAGHINPAIAMAEYLQRRFPRCELLFFGRRGGMEERRIAELSLPFYPLEVQGLQRKLTLRNLRAIKQALTAKSRLTSFLKQERPALVIGTGGYVCYPLLRAAARLDIPTLLHESNTVPGLAVKLLAAHVDHVLLQYEACRRHLSPRATCTVIGAPLRRDFRPFDKKTAKRRLGFDDRFTVLSFGGSQGAERLNEVCLSLMSHLPHEIRWIHACGEAHYEALKARYPHAESTGGHLFPYLTDMAAYMAAADLLICRAGALTLAEISALGKASILIPSPYVPDDHQSKNAALYKAHGAAAVLKEEALCEQLLSEKIRFFEARPSLLRDMEKAARGLASEKTEARFLDIVHPYLSPSSAVE